MKQYAIFQIAIDLLRYQVWNSEKHYNDRK